MKKKKKKTLSPFTLLTQLKYNLFILKPKTSTLSIQPIPANKQTTFLHSEIDVALEQQNPL